MELLNYLKGIPMPVLAIIFVIALLVTVVMAFQYLKQKGLEGIRLDVYKLFLAAEHKFNNSESGKQKLKWVCQQARGMLPGWLSAFISEEVLEQIIDRWFKGIKDLLDDGKLNGSGKTEQ